MGNEVSTYGDVYSYGILLIEIFTGQRLVAKIFQDSLNLHDFVKAALPEQNNWHNRSYSSFGKRRGRGKDDWHYSQWG